MNRHVPAVAGRLSLRAPQRASLEILDRLTELVPLRKQIDRDAALQAVRREFPGVENFGREFPSLCFALATGVGKTRLMGAFIAYLHLAHGIRNYFVLAPNLTIYEKLIRDFTPNTPKYVFKGIAEFVTAEPEIVDGENYLSRGALLDVLGRVKINIFNISKLNSEARGGRQLKMRGFRETLGESYFDYLSDMKDLVLIMDESHRYHGTSGWRALNELKPVLGLELTATPFIESPRGPQPFKNVVYDFPLGQAMEAGFVKEPVVVTRENFQSAGMSASAIQRLKLEDGLRLHEQVKVELQTYAVQSGRHRVKPFVLIIARDTTHAAALKVEVESPSFFGGRYAGRVIQVDSSSREEETVQRLLNVERADEPTEIVVHVNMLKEGWDVSNLYTIIPLRAANARTLIEQSIGRGLRLPYGSRTGIPIVDRLNIVAHDRFQEIVEAARASDSPIRLQSLVLSDHETTAGYETRRSRSRLDTALSRESEGYRSGVRGAEPIFSGSEREIARIAIDAFRRLESAPDRAPTSADLLRPEIQLAVVAEVEERLRPEQTELDGFRAKTDVAAVVAKAAQFMVSNTIDIPRIIVMPKGEVTSGFRPFTLDLSGVRPQPHGGRIHLQELRTGISDAMTLGLRRGTEKEKRLEDYVVRRLIDFADIDYGRHADLLYQLAGQLVEHLLKELNPDETESVLQGQDEVLARLIHAQMQAHYEEGAEDGYEIVVKRGWTTLKESAFTAIAGQATLDFKIAPPDKANIASYVFSGFQRCLYDVQKFQSDAERRLAVILDREAAKWFKSAKGQFQIFYREGTQHAEYVPDFVAETDAQLLLLESKAADQMASASVRAKASVAAEWCRNASRHATEHGGKPWLYALLPHDVITENMRLDGLLMRSTRPRS